MGQRFSSLLGILALSLAAPAWATPLPAAPEEIASYTLRATLDPATHQVRGEGTIRWRNASSRPASELRLHLYLNAFRNTASTWLREGPAAERQRLAAGGWGWIELSRLAGPGGEDLLAGLEYLAPDDGNADDCTVARVPLAAPVPPGGTLELAVAFTAQLPRVVARTGFSNDFHLVAQWFPKLGVLAPDGTWDCHQFHHASEFFADYGTYDVTLVVPRDFVVGATGGRPREVTPGADGTVAYRFVQDRVHDFAWTAWPGFVERRRTFRHPPLPEVEMILLLRPETARHAERTFAALEHALELFGSWYGPYPYPTLTVVDPPWGAREAGGMEYPTFIAAGSRVLSPRATLSPEVVTVHEFGHQYFYGLLASDEFTEPYLDEGINTYATARVLRRAYGRQAWSYRLWELPVVFPAVGLDLPLDSSARYFRRPATDPITRASWGYLDRNAYRYLAYSKMSLVMEEVERTVGAPAMERAMRAYAETFRFRHPRTADLVRTLSRESGRDLGELFRQTLTGSDVLDYAVTTATSARRRGPVGVFGQGEARRTVAAPAAAEGFESVVVVERLGGVRLPVTTELTFADGRTLRLAWDGDERWVRYRVRGPELRWAEVDPDEVLVLDVDRLNNSRRCEPDRRAARRWSQRLRFWIQNLLETAADLA
jgi:Peptidase family M1 domain